MIKGKLKTELTMDTVLERTSPYEIFKYYIPGNWEINEIMCSPLREDKHPSFLVGNKYGELNFKDFAVEAHKGDCFNFVKILYNLPNLDAVLRLIDKDLNLGLSDGLEVRKGPVSDIMKSEGVSKRNTLIQVITRKFTNEELKWWASYYQDIEDLRKENIYSIKKAFLNKRAMSLSELRFGYYYDGLWKIYQPNKDKRGKWITNAPLTTLDGKENIVNCDMAFITKSKKDKMVLRKLYSCVISTQNESMACFSEENVKFIKENSKKQVVLYDSDFTGVYSCTQITQKFDMGYCNVPKSYLPLKDFSDVAKAHGLKEVEKILKNKGYL